MRDADRAPTPTGSRSRWSASPSWSEAHLRRQPPAHHRAPPADARRHRRRDPARHPARPRSTTLMLLRLLRTYLAPYRRWLTVDRRPAVHRDGRDALPAQHQRRHHRQRRGPRATPATSCGSGARDARRLAAADPLLGRRGLRSPHARRCRSATTCGRRSSTGSAPSPAARSPSSAPLADHPEHQRRAAGPDARADDLHAGGPVPIMMVGGILMAMREDLGLSWLLAVVVPALFLVRRARGLADGAELPAGAGADRRGQPDPARADQRHPGGARVRARAAGDPPLREANDDLTEVSVRAGRWMATHVPAGDADRERLAASP